MLHLMIVKVICANINSSFVFEIRKFQTLVPPVFDPKKTHPLVLDVFSMR